MKEYSDKISLIKNRRGVYCLDTSIGCNSGLRNNPRGCYDDCYSAKNAKFYGYDFSKTVLRKFENKNHRNLIVNQINKASLDFVRIGASGDPSENWGHTINICNEIKWCNKEIVLITKHWTSLNENQLKFLATINVTINTSVSALDEFELLNRRLKQYEKLKHYCKSVLRIVSCDFNLENEAGKQLSIIQEKLFGNETTLDTVFRPNKNNKLIKNEIINAKESIFLGKKALVSQYNKTTYFNKCSTCPEMCGLNLKPEKQLYPNKRGIVKQLSLFKNWK